MALVPKSIVVTVTTAGTRVRALATTLASKNYVAAVIQANSGVVAVGDVTVIYSATPASNVGVLLDSANKDKLVLGDASSTNVLDLRNIYFDASASGSIVQILLFEKV